MNLEPHHERMLEERTKLGDNLIKLANFINANGQFKQLSTDEQVRMTKQMQLMAGYYDVLGERLAAAGLDSLPKPIVASTATEMVKGIGVTPMGVLSNFLADDDGPADADQFPVSSMTVREHVVLQVHLANMGQGLGIDSRNMGDIMSKEVVTILGRMGYK